MDKKKPEYLLVLFSYGEPEWTQRTVLAFLSAQARTKDVDILQFRTVIVTDQAKYIKAYFGTWAEIISVDEAGLKGKIKSKLDRQFFRWGIMRDLVASRQIKALSFHSDQYFMESPLGLFQELKEGRIVLGTDEKNQANDRLLGFGPENLTQIESVMKEARDENDMESMPMKIDADVRYFSSSYHYGHELSKRTMQIKSFFEAHYYREMGELYTAASYWTPDQWDLPKSAWKIDIV